MNPKIIFLLKSASTACYHMMGSKDGSTEIRKGQWTRFLFGPGSASEKISVLLGAYQTIIANHLIMTSQSSAGSGLKNFQFQNKVVAIFPEFISFYQ